jgi:hypothetical protein
MFDCKKCGHIFRDSYDLSKHLMRKKPCIQMKNKIEYENKNFSGNITIDPGNTTELKCIYCLNDYSTKYNLKAHEDNCKCRKDPVRILELEKGIKPKIPCIKTECRFCNRDYYRIDNLNRHLKSCKKREDYHQALLKQESQEQPFRENVLDHLSNYGFLIFVEKYYKSINENNQIKPLLNNFLIDLKNIIK